MIFGDGVRRDRGPDRVRSPSVAAGERCHLRGVEEEPERALVGEDRPGGGAAADDLEAALAQAGFEPSPSLVEAVRGLMTTG